MDHAPRYDESLARIEGHNAVFEIDVETPFYYIEEFVIVIVLVPVVFALDHAQSHDRVVDLAQGLVEPRMLDRADQRLEVDNFELREEDVETGVVGVGG